MYYDDIKQMSTLVADAYEWEKVDGMPRYRWYKTALNSVFMISECDAKFDIDNCSFSDLKYWYDCTEWVANNDEEALVHIYAELIPPVTQIVKDRYIAGLLALGYYRPCALAKKYLQAYPVPKQRTLERRKERAEKLIREKVIQELEFNDSFLAMLKKDVPDKLVDMDEVLQENIGKLLTLEYKLYGERLDESFTQMEWMRLYATDKLEQMFSFEISKEIKDQLMLLLEKYEFFHLRILLDKSLTLKASPFYFGIPIYTRTRQERLSDYFDMNEED